jgi:hypothetical protein
LESNSLVDTTLKEAGTIDYTSTKDPAHTLHKEISTGFLNSNIKMIIKIHYFKHSLTIPELPTSVSSFGKCQP